MISKRPLRDVTQKCPVPLALTEQGIGEKAINLGPLLAVRNSVRGHS